MLQKRLPDAEFEIMRAVWSLPEPATSPLILDWLAPREILPQTVVTMLRRLERKGFLRSEKHGKEREYYALISEDAYMRFEAQRFAGKFSRQGAFSSLAAALYGDGKLDAESVEELQRWLDERKDGND